MEYGQKRSRDDYAPEDATYGQGGGRGPPYYGHQQQGGPPPPHQQGRYDPPPGQSSRWSGPEPAYVKQEPNRYEPPPQAAQYEPSPKSYQSPSSGYSFSPARPSRSPPRRPREDYRGPRGGGGHSNGYDSYGGEPRPKRQALDPGDMLPVDAAGNYNAVILVPSASMGMLIGKGGSTRQEIAQGSGAKIRIQDHVDVPEGSFDRAITISGSWERVSKAESLILAKLKARKESMHGEAGISDSLEGTDPDPKQLIRYLIPTQSVGLLIGRRGSSLQALMEEVGARIRVVNEEEMPKGSADRIVTIVGNRDERERAIKAIQTRVGGRPLDPINGNQVRVPVKAIGFILGHGGQNIKQLREQSGARIQVANLTEVEAGSATVRVDLEGSPAMVEAARSMLRDRVNKWKVEEGNLEADSEISLKMAVPKALIGHMIGRGGATVKEQAKHGVLVKVLQDAKSHSRLVDDRPVLLLGRQEEVLEAQRRLLDHLGTAPQHLLAQIRNPPPPAPYPLGPPPPSGPQYGQPPPPDPYYRDHAPSPQPGYGHGYGQPQAAPYPPPPSSSGGQYGSNSSSSSSSYQYHGQSSGGGGAGYSSYGAPAPAPAPAYSAPPPQQYPPQGGQQQYGSGGGRDYGGSSSSSSYRPGGSQYSQDPAPAPYSSYSQPPPSSSSSAAAAAYPPGPATAAPAPAPYGSYGSSSSSAAYPPGPAPAPAPSYGSYGPSSSSSSSYAPAPAPAPYGSYGSSGSSSYPPAPAPAPAPALAPSSQYGSYQSAPASSSSYAPAPAAPPNGSSSGGSAAMNPQMANILSALGQISSSTSTGGSGGASHSQGGGHSLLGPTLIPPSGQQSQQQQSQQPYYGSPPQQQQQQPPPPQSGAYYGGQHAPQQQQQQQYGRYGEQGGYGR